jgi:hypothetical protein
MRRLAATLFLAALLAGCRRETPRVTFDAAEREAANSKFARARELFRRAAIDERDPTQRARAYVALANIEWRIFHEPAAAREALGHVTPSSSEYVVALIERARLEFELVHDDATARKKTRDALAIATSRNDRRRAVIADSIAATEPLLRDRRDGRCTATGDLASVAGNLRDVITRDGPLLSPVLRLFSVALLRGDGPSMLRAWRWYYGITPDMPSTLGRLLPGWRGDGATTDERREVGVALAAARMYDAASLVLRDPCARTPLPRDAEVDAIVTYTQALRRYHDVAEEHYRDVARGAANDRAFRRQLEAEGERLWRELRMNGAYDRNAFAAELRRRFGTVITTGRTAGVEDVHFAHAVRDEQLPIEQYGRRATLRFIALDGVVSNGYSSFASDGRSGDGGWTSADGIYQVRPMYCDGPVRLWLSVADPELRADADREMAEETKRDVERAAVEAIRPFPGLELRMRREDAEQIRRETAGDRDAFIARSRADVCVVNHRARRASCDRPGLRNDP